MSSSTAAGLPSDLVMSAAYGPWRPLPVYNATTISISSWGLTTNDPG